MFCATGVVALALAAWATSHPEPVRTSPRGEPGAERSIPAQLRAAVAAGGFGIGTWLILLEAAFFGAAGVLLPLRMSHLGVPGLGDRRDVRRRLRALDGALAVRRGARSTGTARGGR